MKRSETLVYSAAGVVVLFLALVALNYLVGAAPARVDLTANKLYTLSEGTKKTLKSLTAPVKIRLYVSRGEAMPVQLRGFAQRVEDLLSEFASVAGSNLIIERYDPKPDSDEEEPCATARDDGAVH